MAGMDCQTIFEQHEYNSKEDCIKESQYVSQYMQQVFPNSSGEIFCLSREDFDALNKKLLEQQTPSL
jgi:hypothetical protein|tara:strand:+ start:213 stop:413 length:201 start_codon:yes stop_codon:yes gene_type:complete